MMELAPIVLFAYSRPEHTLKTLMSLKDNILADKSILHIYIDGVKENASESLVENNRRVREIAKSQQWCGEVIVHQSCINKGLAESIKQGVSETLKINGKIIVLEDDLFLSPAFLTFMNKSLDFYENYPAVFSIGGYTYPDKIMTIPDDYIYDTYACLRNCSWGWATWISRWDRIDWNAKQYSTIKENNSIKLALNRMGDDEFEMFESQQEKGLNIWSILFTNYHFVNHAVAIIPCKSYVNNLGLDGSGENCNIHNNLIHDNLNNELNPRFLDIIYEDNRIINAFYNVNCRNKRPILKKIINRIFRIFGKKSPFVLKGKVYA